MSSIHRNVNEDLHETLVQCHLGIIIDICYACFNYIILLVFSVFGTVHDIKARSSASSCSDSTLGFDGDSMQVDEADGDSIMAGGG